MPNPNIKPQLTPEILVPRLGDYLVERGLITADELKRALMYQQSAKTTSGLAPQLGQVLISMGFLSREDLDQAITEQILLLREALQRNNQLLEQRVQERTAELEQALRKLNELNQLKTNFVSNISHELRTPLTHLKGYLELFLTEAFGQLSTEQLQVMNIMKQSSDRLGQLIEDLILFSTAERGQIHLNIQETSLPDIVNKTIHRFQERAREKKIEFIVHCPNQLPPVQADAEKITWVIDQLVDNALKFTNSGGMVVLACEMESFMVKVSVTDTGIGIPKERIGELFEPFHQLDGSSTRRYGGTGLGLALVKKIVEAHGTNVQVKSEAGKGSRFEFFLCTKQ